MDEIWLNASGNPPLLIYIAASHLKRWKWDMVEIWTGDVRRVLYGRLVEQFGSLDKWTSHHSPGGEQDEKFNEFCKDFARVVGAKSGDAVKQQIRFAMPESSNGSVWEEGHARTAILNKAAALEAGFIGNRHLPNLLAVGRTATLDDLV